MYTLQVICMTANFAYSMRAQRYNNIMYIIISTVTNEWQQIVLGLKRMTDKAGIFFSVSAVVLLYRIKSIRFHGRQAALRKTQPVRFIAAPYDLCPAYSLMSLTIKNVYCSVFRTSYLLICVIRS